MSDSDNSTEEATVVEICRMIMLGSTRETRQQVEQMADRAIEIGKSVPGLNTRVLGQPNAKRQLGFVIFTLSRAIVESAKVGRLYQEKLDRQGYVKLLGDLRDVNPALRNSKVEKKDPPVPWVWTEGNGQTLKNPYLEETKNLSDIAFLEKHDPRLAEMLKVEARGGYGYKELFELRERERLMNEAAVYDGPNVFLEDDSGDQEWNLSDKLIAQTELRKMNPILCDQLIAEKNGVVVNAWTPPGNLTLQLSVEKANSELAHLLKVAGHHERVFLDRELDEARAAAAKAQFEAVQAGNRLARSR